MQTLKSYRSTGGGLEPLFVSSARWIINLALPGDKGLSEVAALYREYTCKTGTCICMSGSKIWLAECLPLLSPFYNNISDGN